MSLISSLNYFKLFFCCYISLEVKCPDYMLYSRCIGTVVLMIEDNLPCTVERRCQEMWKCKFCNGFEIFGKKERSISCVSPGTDTSNNDNEMHLSPNDSVIQVHFVGGKFLPSLFLLSELKIQFEVCLLRHSSWHSCLYDFCCSVAKWKINHRISISKSPTIFFADVQLYYWSLLFCPTFIVNN